MSWSSPRTWANGDIPTGTQFNTEIRDNLLFLYTFETTHTHTGTTDGLKIGTTAIPANAVIPASATITTPTISSPTVSGHIHASGTVPTVAVGAGAGTTGTATISGHDTAGEVTITPGGTGITSGSKQATVTFNAGFVGTPVILVSSVGNGGVRPWVAQRTSTTFEIWFDTAGVAATVYIVTFQVIDPS